VPKKKYLRKMLLILSKPAQDAGLTNKSKDIGEELQVEISNSLKTSKMFSLVKSQSQLQDHQRLFLEILTERLLEEIKKLMPINHKYKTHLWYTSKR